MLDARALMAKHKAKGVSVDTNLLVLLLVGLVNSQRIRMFKRTQDFSVRDFLVLQKLVRWFGSPLYSTPHILSQSQVSDLTDLSGQELVIVRQLLKTLVTAIEERYDTAKELVQHPLFERFGMADAAAAATCGRGILVLTVDLQLQVALGASGLDAINFNHVRALE